VFGGDSTICRLMVPRRRLELKASLLFCLLRDLVAFVAANGLLPRVPSPSHIRGAGFFCVTRCFIVVSPSTQSAELPNQTQPLVRAIHANRSPRSPRGFYRAQGRAIHANRSPRSPRGFYRAQGRAIHANRVPRSPRGFHETSHQTIAQGRAIHANHSPRSPRGFYRAQGRAIHANRSPRSPRGFYRAQGRAIHSIQVSRSPRI